MKTLTLLVSILLFMVAPLQSAVLVGFGESGAAPIFLETFEATGYDNAVWTETGTPDEDYTTGPLCGSQSLDISSTTAVVQSSDLGEYTGIKFLIKFGTLTNSADSYQFAMRDSTGTTNLGLIAVTSSDYFKIACGTANVTDNTMLLSATATYMVWLDYVKGTGSNAQLRLYVAEDASADCVETKPGTPLLTITTGTSTLNAQTIRILQSNAMSSHILWDNVEITQ